MAWFDFEGRRVWHERQGSGDPIVFLPNATLDGRLWERQVAHFKDHYDAIVVDLPGFGRSDHLTPSRDLWVRWLGRFVDELQLAPVTLVGNCMGSLTALTYAADHPGARRHDLQDRTGRTRLPACCAHTDSPLSSWPRA